RGHGLWPAGGGDGRGRGARVARRSAGPPHRAARRSRRAGGRADAPEATGRAAARRAHPGAGALVAAGDGGAVRRDLWRGRGGAVRRRIPPRLAPPRGGRRQGCGQDSLPRVRGRAGVGSVSSSAACYPFARPFAGGWSPPQPAVAGGVRSRQNWAFHAFVLLVPLQNLHTAYVPNLGGGLNFLNLMFLASLAMALRSGGRLVHGRSE